jgi:Tfp pilus assembly protein PilF
LANLALRKGDSSTAENELQHALTADPKSAIAHMAMADFLFSRKDMDRAGQEFKIAAELAPARSPSAHEICGISGRSRGAQRCAGDSEGNYAAGS